MRNQRTDEVQHEPNRGSDSECRVPQPREEADPTRDQAGGKEWQHTERDSEMDEVLEDDLIAGDLCGRRGKHAEC
jgi:hypothetical protein